jgi:hypothetical protein
MPSGYGCGYSAVQELVDSLVSFKLSGKSIIGFCSNPNQLDYLVYSVCDELHMNPSGVFVLKGLASEQLFLAEHLKSMVLVYRLYELVISKVRLSPLPQILSVRKIVYKLTVYWI